MTEWLWPTQNHLRADAWPFVSRIQTQLDSPVQMWVSKKLLEPMHISFSLDTSFLSATAHIAMPLSTKLERKLGAVDESSDGEDYYHVTDRSSSESLIETGEGGNVISSDEEEGHDDASETASSDASGDNVVQTQMSKVSFGALAKAQDGLQNEHATERKRKRGDNTSKSHEDKLETLRERLRQIKANKLAAGGQSSTKGNLRTAKKATQKEHNDEESDHDQSEHMSNSESEPSTSIHARSSKHAPAVQSSKRMVSRKRQVVDVKKRQVRDPRFDGISGSRLDENVVGARYSFLNDYRASEIADLKTTIKKTKDEAEKERLKKKLLSMESQEHTRKRKEEQQNVVREHRKNEKELIKKGKQPFYLKKCTSSPCVLWPFLWLLHLC